MLLGYRDCYFNDRFPVENFKSREACVPLLFLKRPQTGPRGAFVRAVSGLRASIWVGRLWTRKDKNEAEPGGFFVAGEVHVQQ